jgi:hypothetical protein
LALIFVYPKGDIRLSKSNLVWICLLEQTFKEDLTATIKERSIVMWTCQRDYLLLIVTILSLLAVEAWK